MKLTAIALTIWSVTAPVQSEELTFPTEEKRAQRAEDQNSAIRLSKSKDLPALKKADRLLITHKPTSSGLRSIELSDKDKLHSIRSLLAVKKVRPSSGIPWAHLKWFAGDNPVRVIWVMENGEWGFFRKGTSYSVGINPELVKSLKVISSMKKTGEHGVGE